eukprot:2704523-Pleurochrysis_carterae.AAC.1
MQPVVAKSHCINDERHLSSWEWLLSVGMLSQMQESKRREYFLSNGCEIFPYLAPSAHGMLHSMQQAVD